MVRQRNSRFGALPALRATVSWGGDKGCLPVLTLADGILDQLVNNAHRVEMRGDSMRKNRGKSNA
jgi:hypothetical protein